MAKKEIWSSDIQADDIKYITRLYRDEDEAIQMAFEAKWDELGEIKNALKKLMPTKIFAKITGKSGEAVKAVGENVADCLEFEEGCYDAAWSITEDGDLVSDQLDLDEDKQVVYRALKPGVKESDLKPGLFELLTEPIGPVVEAGL